MSSKAQRTPLSHETLVAAKVDGSLPQKVVARFASSADARGLSCAAYETVKELMATTALEEQSFRSTLPPT